MVFRLMLGFVLLMSLVGCSSEESIRSKSLANLQIGMSKEEVLSIMGKPQRQETHGDAEILFYTTASAGDMQEDMTSVTIISGRLVSWGAASTMSKP
jgi:outer membrane protein assembly factor BamE (lipoprotein component of BamABCDE complex)